MTVALIALFAAITLFMFYQMISPFLVSHEEQLRYDLLDEEMRKVEELTTQKNLYIDNLREIENDFELDKISEEDYLDLKRRYERASILIMRELDDIHGGRDWEARVDALTGGVPTLAAAHQADVDAAPLPSPDSSHPIAEVPSAEADTVAREDEATEDTLTCRSCGSTLDATDRFCSQCGTPVADEDAETAAE